MKCLFKLILSAFEVGLSAVGIFKSSTMYLLILFFIASTSAWPHNCRGILFNNKFYEPETIKEGVNKIEKLVINHNDNTLWFIFDNLDTYPNKVLGYVNLDTKALGVVKGIRNASSVAIDQTNNVVYAGGAEGLYIVNGQKVPERQPIFHNINDMFFKDILYFTSKRNEAFKVINNVVFRMPELQNVEVDKILVDDDNSMFFTANRALYRVQLGTRMVNTHERAYVETMAVDAYFKPFIATLDGVYVYNKYKYALDRVSMVKGLNALTINKQDDPIYGVVDAIIKLNVNEKACYDFNNLQ